MKYTKGLLFFLIIAEIILATYSVYESNTNFATCLTGSNCREVQNSAYGTMFGMKLSTIGIIVFPILLIIYYLTYKRKIPKYIFPITTLIGAVFSLYFIYIQFFILKKLCSTCIAIDSIMITIFIISIIDFYKK